MANAERLKELMTTLDDAWIAQDLDTFAQRHKPDTIVRWPGQPPTHGIEARRQEAIDFFTAFPDQHLDNRPYKVLIAEGDWTCSVAHFTGTMKGPMKAPTAPRSLPPGGRSRWTSAPWLAGTTSRSSMRSSSMTSSRS